MREEKQKWYTALRVDRKEQEFFSATLIEVKKYLLDWLTQVNPTYLETGWEGPGWESAVVYEKKVAEGYWICCRRSERTVLQYENDRAFYETIIPWIFTQTGPEYEEILLDPYEKRICLERVKTIAKQDDIDMVNLMAWRGWRLLSLEHHPEKVVYIMGHEEHRAF